MRVAFLGQPGSNSEAAVVQSYGPDFSPVHCESFEEIFEAVAAGKADQGALPIENSLAGTIYGGYDLLQRFQLHIVGEIIYQVQNYLLALPGVMISEIERVMSHPQPLAQCDAYLKRHGWDREACSDTTAAARRLGAENLRKTAVIATKRAGELYGLIELDSKIEDDPENYTRFLLLAREPIMPYGNEPYKTSIVFALENRPKSLYEALAVFARHEINLAKIESRPLRKRVWEYLFYLDFIVDPDSHEPEIALAELGKLTSSLRILGSYPQDNS